MTFQDYFLLNSINAVNCFVLDCREGGLYNDEPMVRYPYNRSINNRLNVGDFTIFRVLHDSSFSFVGVGIIEEICTIDNGGNQEAYINFGFRFTEPLNKNSERLTSMQWQFRERGSNWAHFFNMYGITQIHQNDFLNLIHNALGQPIN